MAPPLLVALLDACVLYPPLLRDLMNQHGGDCLVQGYEGIIDSLSLPDADDRHVLAAAITGKASVIVTFNLHDFPAKALNPYGVVALAPDLFVCSLYQTQPVAIIQAARHMHQASKNPPKTREEFIDGLRRNHLTHFAEIVEAEL